MTTEERINSLLLAWQERQATGQEVPPAELCRDCPELAGELARRVDLLRRQMASLQSGGDAPPPGLAAGQVAHASPSPESAYAQMSTPWGPDTPGGPAATDIDLSFLEPPTTAQDLGRLGEYRVLAVIGRGGMGVVLRAEDPRLERQVAVKVLKGALLCSEARQRFLQEARNAAKLEHERVVPVYQVGEHAGLPYLVMPLLKGEALDRRLSRLGRPPLSEALRIAREMAEGLAAAHAAGLVHRDVKPGNVWLKEPTDSVLLLDFGLARSEDAGLDLTHVGQLVGTPSYMAPEQAAGEKVDWRADLFSLGCVLYELLTGRRPFGGPNTFAVLQQLAVHVPPPPCRVVPGVPTAVSELTQRLLAKDPAGRPTAHEVAKALADLSRTAAAAAPQAGARRRLRPALFLGMGAVLAPLAVVVCSILGVFRGRRPVPPTPPGPPAVAAQPGQVIPQAPPTGPAAKPGSPAGWREFRSAHARFAVWMPGTPKYKRAGEAGKEHDQFTVEDLDRATYYVIAFTEHPKVIFPDPMAALAAARDFGVGRVQGKVLSDVAIRLGEYPGRDVTFTSPALKGLQGRLRLYLVGRRFYHLMMMAPPARLRGTEASQFFDSFRLLPND